MPLKTWKNCSQKLLIIGPKPFFSLTSLKTWKKRPQKLLLIGPNFFFSIANRPKISPNLIFCSIKMAPIPSIRWLWSNTLVCWRTTSLVVLGSILYLVDTSKKNARFCLWGGNEQNIHEPKLYYMYISSTCFKNSNESCTFTVFCLIVIAPSWQYCILLFKGQLN